MNKYEKFHSKTGNDQNSEGAALPDAAPNPSGPPVGACCLPGTSFRVVLLDDRQLTRESLRALIHSLDPNLTVAEAASPADVPQLIQNADLASVVVANIVGTGSNHLPWLDHICGTVPYAPVGVLTDIDDPPTVRAMLNSGVRGVISPATPGNVFVGALHMLSVGGTYIPASLLSRPTGATCAAAVAQTEQSVLRAFPMLSSRQATVLRLIAEGLTNHEIAEALRISANTVKVHVHNIFERLEVHRRVDAARLVATSIDSAAEQTVPQG